MQQVTNFSRMNSNKEYHLSFPCAHHFWWSKSWPPPWIAEFTIPKFFYIFNNLKTQTIHTYQKLHFMKIIVELRAISKLSYVFWYTLYILSSHTYLPFACQFRTWIYISSLVYFPPRLPISLFPMPTPHLHAHFTFERQWACLPLSSFHNLIGTGYNCIV